MSEAPATPATPETPPPANPPAPETPPAPPANPPAPSPATSGETVSLRDLHATLQALPERLVNAVREATQPPRQPATPPPAAGNPTQTPGEGDPKLTRHQKFLKMWFG